MQPMPCTQSTLREAACRKLTLAARGLSPNSKAFHGFCLPSSATIQASLEEGEAAPLSGPAEFKFWGVDELRWFFVICFEIAYSIFGIVVGMAEIRLCILQTQISASQHQVCSTWPLMVMTKHLPWDFFYNHNWSQTTKIIKNPMMLSTFALPGDIWPFHTPHLSCRLWALIHGLFFFISWPGQKTKHFPLSHNRDSNKLKKYAQLSVLELFYLAIWIILQISWVTSLSLIPPYSCGSNMLKTHHTTVIFCWKLSQHTQQIASKMHPWQQQRLFGQLPVPAQYLWPRSINHLGLSFGNERTLGPITTLTFPQGVFLRSVPPLLFVEMM